MSEATTPKTHKFEAEVSQVLSLVINSLYSNKEVFLRELVSNAADALDKLRFESVQNPALQQAGYQPKIRLIPDEKAKTLTIADNGIGMTEASLAKDLGTVARSGSKELIERLQKADQKHDLKLIGQFGVGFYSGFLVADHIDVISRAAGSDVAHKWSSEGKDTFLLEPAQREEVGTSIVLYLKSEFEEFTKEWKLRELVERYSNFIQYPIELQVTRSKKDEPDEV
ncbi:MAG: ATP-binding protein, partial [Polyangiales bacterium]